ncbi:MAG: type II toxin-antitoxin system RelE/ParE family toxin [Vicinamibacteria bacterium]
MTPLIIRPAAAAEIDEAYLWYESQRTGLGEEFLVEVNGALDTIREMPELYAVVHRDTRRAMLVRFPYSLLYRLVNKQVIVVACFHGKRDPKGWQGRR